MDLFGKLLAGVAIGILAIVLIALVGVVAAIPTYYLWNWLMPDIFGLKVITFWQAWGLFFLGGLLLKGSSSSSSK